jgi:hypothetical protein
MNTSDYPKLYSWTQIKVKERLVVRKDIDVNEQMAGRHDIAEILLKVTLNTKKSNQINQPVLSPL